MSQGRQNQTRMFRNETKLTQPQFRRSTRTQPTAQPVGKSHNVTTSPEWAKDTIVGTVLSDLYVMATSGPGINFVNFPLRFSPFICYKQSTESRCVAAGVFVASLGIVRHLRKRREFKRSQLSRPRDFIRKGRHFPKGTFKARNLQLGSFLNFLSSVSGCVKRAPKVAFYPRRKAILLRA
jgi:hypothetical protein